MNALPHELAQLAHEAGVLTSYHDIAGKEQKAGVEPLLAVLRALGLPIDSPDQAGRVIQERLAARAGRVIEPVLVHWLGTTFGLTIRVPSRHEQTRLRLTLKLEHSEERLTHGTVAHEIPAVEGHGEEMVQAELRQLRLPWTLPPGYHRLEIELGDETHASLVVAAPNATEPAYAFIWGIFAPLYALRSERNWGIGDFGDLADLGRQAAQAGAGLLGTLPLYATFLDQPCDPSPYAPCSRLFWNEAFVHMEAVPEWSECAEARRLAESDEFQKALSRLRLRRLVDHRAVMKRKRAVLEVMCAWLAGSSSERAGRFRRLLADDTDLLDYARFRAAMEKSKGVWQTWSERQRSGTLGASDYDEKQVLYHAYVQWLTRAQLSRFTDAGQPGSELYLDLPLGIHPSGYDAYRHQELFMQGASTGAPPDTFFSEGQDWGSPPINPHRQRASGYAYFAAVLRNTLRYASALRVDHVMGFHRLFVIPHGAKAREGVYVRFPAEELYAVLLLEAGRSRCRLLAGEDLGTVPDEVRRAMDQRGLARLFVWQYQLEPQNDHALKPVPPGQVASLNTHDMPTFTGFAHGTDVIDRFRMGLFSPPEVEVEQARRKELVARGGQALRDAGWLSARATPRSLLSASLSYLASSPARLLMVSLEDLWLEADPQNVPGTYRERPNWMRKTRYTLEKGLALSVVKTTLKKINELRARTAGRAARGKQPEG